MRWLFANSAIFASGAIWQMKTRNLSFYPIDSKRRVFSGAGNDASRDTFLTKCHLGPRLFKTNDVVS